MKTKNLVFVVLFIVLMGKLIPVCAQNIWSPPGATWYYDYFNVGAAGYVEIKYIGDSIVDGQQTKVLRKILYWVSYIKGYSIDTIGYEYTYISNDTVYNYRMGKFYVLYDFNANAGDRWTVGGHSQSGNCDSTGVMKVDSTGIAIINTFSLKYLYLSPDTANKWQLFGRISERIGSIDGYMLPETNCLLDGNEGGPLRCYYDSAFGWYSTGFTANCTDIAGIENVFNAENKIIIYPNPSYDKLNISFNAPPKAPNPTTLHLCDLTGRIIMEKTFSAVNGENKMEMDVSRVAKGVYFLNVVNHSGGGNEGMGVVKVVIE